MTNNPFQTVPVNFGKGLDTKTDPNQVKPPHCLVLENGVFPETEGVKVRNGYTRIGQLGTGNGLLALGSELVALTDTSVQAYSAASATFASRGSYDKWSLGFYNVSVAAKNQTQPNTAVNSSGQVCSVWKDLKSGGSSTIRCRITDSSGIQIVSEFEVASKASTTVDTPQVWAFSTKFVFVYHWNDGTDRLGFKSIDYATFTLSNETALANGKLPAGYYFSTTDKVLLSYVDSSSNHKAAYMDSSATLTASATVSSDGATITRIYCTGRINTNPENFILYVSSGTIKYVMTNNSMTTLFGPAVIDSSTATLDKPVGHYNGTSYQCYWTEKNSGSESVTSFIKQTTVSTGGAVGALTTYLRNRTVAGGSFQQGTSSYVMAYKYGTTTAFELLTGSTTPRLVALLGSGTVSAPDTTYFLPTLSNKYFLPILSIASGFRDSSFALQSNIAMYTLSNSVAPVGEAITKSLFISGPHIYEYDGANVQEAGFPLPDDIVTLGTTGTGITGTFLYKYTFSWVNAKGVLEESAPCTAKSTGSVSNVTNTVQIRTLKLTDKPAGTIKINLYRTVTNGTTYFLCQQADNDTTVDTITINDATTDTNLQSNAQSYFTSGTNGVLDNGVVPHAAVVKAFASRMLYLAIPDEPFSFYYSKQDQGYAVPTSFKKSIPSETNDPLTAGARMDDKFILFTKSGIFALTGVGPDNTGNNNDFQLYRIPSDVGCVDQRTIAETADGVFFGSANGVYFLDRSLRVKYAGSGVEAFNGLTLNSSAVYADLNEVRFTTSSDTVLVCNYYFNLDDDNQTLGMRWSVFTGFNAVGSKVLNSLYYHIKANGDVFAENKTGAVTDYNDNGSPIKVRARCPWITGDNKNLSLKRIRRIAMLGVFSSSNLVSMLIHRDYVYGASEMASNQNATNVSYGSNTYGTGSYGGTGVMKLRHSLAKQKLNAVSVEIVASCLNQSFVLTAIELEMLVKPGLKQSTSF